MTRSVGAIAAIWVIAAAWAFPCSAQEQAGRGAKSASIFDVGRERATRAVVTLGDDLPELEEPDSPMRRELAGVLADLKGKSLDELRACVPPAPMIGDMQGAERECVIHLIAKSGKKTLGLFHAKDGGWVAAELGVSGVPDRAELRKDAVNALLAGWPTYRGGFGDGAVKNGDKEEKPGEVFKLEGPYAAGRYTIDEATLSARVMGGRKAPFEGTTRQLEQDAFFVRLPVAYDPKQPAGMLVWVDAGPSGRIPDVFNTAVDALNIVCIGAEHSGNDRLVVTRFQLALDAAATAARRFHIDSRRVYISGISGGGRVASMLQGCFPEVFTGAVPIVGLSFYDNVPTGTGHFWPAGYAKPKPDLFAILKTRRIGAISGRRDENLLEMQNATQLYTRDGVPVKLFEHAKMGHELPTADAFSEALRWVDAPYQTARASENEAANRALEGAMVKGGKASETSRKLLLKVTEVGPWTDAAWKAIDELGK